MAERNDCFASDDDRKDACLTVHVAGRKNVLRIFQAGFYARHVSFFGIYGILWEWDTWFCNTMNHVFQMKKEIDLPEIFSRTRRGRPLHAAGGAPPPVPPLVFFFFFVFLLGPKFDPFRLLGHKAARTPLVFLNDQGKEMNEGKRRVFMIGR